MLKDVGEIFKDLERKDPKLRLDIHNPHEGIYVKINPNKNIETQLNSLSSSVLVYKRNEEVAKKNHQLFQWFKERDFYNFVINDSSNKTLANKKIWSTTFYSIAFREKNFIKGKQFLKDEEILSFVLDHIDKLNSENRTIAFRNLFESKIFKKSDLSKEEQLERFFKSDMDYLRSKEREDKYESMKTFWEQNFIHIWKKVSHYIHQQGISVKNAYIKLYIEDESEVYQKEHELYLKTRIFNKNDYNTIEEDEIIGVPMSINQNGKKPFLELKTTKFRTPDRVSLDEAILQKDLFIWLKNYINQNGKKEAVKKVSYEDEIGKLTNSTHYLKLNGNDVTDHDNVPYRNESIKFEWKNILNYYENGKIDYLNRMVDSRQELVNYISYYFFKKLVVYKYLEDVPKVESGDITGNIIGEFVQARKSLFDYANKNINALSIKTLKAMRKTLKELMINGIPVDKSKIKENGSFYEQKKQYVRAIDLYLSLGDYVLGGEVMSKNYLDIKKCVKEKIWEYDSVLENNEQFYFLAGQLGFYFMSLSKSKNKNFSMVKPLLTSNKISKVKRFLINQHANYDHEIETNNVPVKKAMELVLSYSDDENKKLTDNDEVMLYCGINAYNFLIKKGEKKDEKK